MKIFISYRRSDSKHIVGRIYDRLAAQFGRVNVFKDVDNIPFGVDFRRVLDEAVSQCHVLLAVIGPTWQGAVNEAGQLRLHDPSDFVRVEIESALRRAIPVIPIFVMGAGAIQAERLPESLRDLAFRNGLPVREDPDFHQDMSRLIESLKAQTKRGTRPRAGNFSGPPGRQLTRPMKWLAGCALAGAGLIVLAVGAFLVWRYLIKPPAATATEPPAIVAPAPATTVVPELPAVPTEIAATLTPETAFSPPTPTFTPSPTSTPTATSLPTTILDAKGHEMVLIPAGEFVMGTNYGDVSTKPAHTVFLSDYYMDQFEVTNEQYVRFLGARGNQTEGGNTWIEDWGRVKMENGQWEITPGYEKHPVIAVTWYGARAYCEWRGAILPTEAQWEKSARGTDSRTYPWGESVNSQLANFANVWGDTKVVGTHLAGASPYGLLDMAGNVMEWVADWYSQDYYPESPDVNPAGPANGDWKILRGGGWASPSELLTTSVRIVAAQFLALEDAGFRCAKLP